MIDNLTEAIAHAREVAKENRNGARLFANNPFYGTTSTKYEECARDHEQLASWLTELAERREADRWIPVSERLPDTYGEYLITTCAGDVRKDIYNDYFKKFNAGKYVIAWKPLPKPYEPKGGAE